MSQESTLSSVPSELTENQDDEFTDELNLVDELYFCRSDEINDSLDADESDNESVNYDSDSHFSDNDSLVHIEPSVEDNSEYIKQAKFRNDTCGCKEFYGQPCSNMLDFECIVDYRESCQEMSREELDIVIKSQLLAHRRSGSHTNAKKHKVKERERPFQEFFFHGKRVCRSTFCFLHNIERKKLLAISKSLDEDGLRPRVHGRVGKAPAHSLTFIDRERVKTFICEYARDNMHCRYLTDYQITGILRFFFCLQISLRKIFSEHTVK